MVCISRCTNTHIICNTSWQVKNDHDYDVMDLRDSCWVTCVWMKWWICNSNSVGWIARHLWCANKAARIEDFDFISLEEYVVCYRRVVLRQVCTRCCKLPGWKISATILLLKKERIGPVVLGVGSWSYLVYFSRRITSRGMMFRDIEYHDVGSRKRA